MADDPSANRTYSRCRIEEQLDLYKERFWRVVLSPRPDWYLLEALHQAICAGERSLFQVVSLGLCSLHDCHPDAICPAKFTWRSG